MDLDHGADDMYLPIEKRLDRQHGREICPKAKIHHCCLNKVIQVMPHGNQGNALFLTIFKHDSPSVTGTKITIEFTFEGIGILPFVDNLEIDIELTKIGFEFRPVFLWDGMLNPVDHQSLEIIGNGQPLPSKGKGKGHGQRILPARD
jgi:hypothetical protein